MFEALLKLCQVVLSAPQFFTYSTDYLDFILSSGTLPQASGGNRQRLERRCTWCLAIWLYPAGGKGND